MRQEAKGKSGEVGRFRHFCLLPFAFRFALFLTLAARILQPSGELVPHLARDPRRHRLASQEIAHRPRIALGQFAQRPGYRLHYHVVAILHQAFLPAVFLNQKPQARMPAPLNILDASP
jgi:hypothetical protein